MKKAARQRRHKSLYQRRVCARSPAAAPPCGAASKSVVTVMAYGPDEVVEQKLNSVADLDTIPPLIDRFPVTWVNVEGLDDGDVSGATRQYVQAASAGSGRRAQQSPRSKVEQYGDHLFIVARMVEGGEQLESDQLGMFLGKKFLLTFQHLVGDCLNPLRDNIRAGDGLVRNSGPDYLAYAIIDQIVDSYFPILERFGEQIEALEDVIMDRPERGVIRQTHDVKSKLLVLRRASGHFAKRCTS